MADVCNLNNILVVLAYVQFCGYFSHNKVQCLGGKIVRIVIGLIVK